MRGQLTGLWRAANGQPLPWQNPRRFSWSVWEPGIPTGVRQQGPGADSLPAAASSCRCAGTAHRHLSLLPGRGCKEGTSTASVQNNSNTPNS